LLLLLSSIYEYIKTVLPGDVDWNFHKYLINREGIPVKSFAVTDDPITIIPDILKLL
jgi:glutathione peroxidase